MDHRDESWEQYRRRMLDETSRFIEWGLANPEQVVGIPARPVGSKGFAPGMSQWFWQTVLCERPTDRMRRWLDLMRGRRLVSIVGRRRR